MSLPSLWYICGRAANCSTSPSPKAIDRLLAIADYEAVLDFGLAVFYEGDEISPLEHGGILKLIDQYGVIPVADALVDNGRVLLIDYMADALLKLTDVKRIIFALVLAEHLIDLREQHEGIDIAQQEFLPVYK